MLRRILLYCSIAGNNWSLWRKLFSKAGIIPLQTSQEFVIHCQLTQVATEILQNNLAMYVTVQWILSALGSISHTVLIRLHVACPHISDNATMTTRKSLYTQAFSCINTLRPHGLSALSMVIIRESVDSLCTDMPTHTHCACDTRILLLSHAHTQTSVCHTHFDL